MKWDKVGLKVSNKDSRDFTEEGLLELVDKL